MGLRFHYADGQTPLTEEEKEGLIISTITTQGELNEFEEQNIYIAIQWVTGRSFSQDRIFTEPFLRNLHKRMYGEVWSWAGDFRRTEKNIGVPWLTIPTQLKQLLDDAIFWIANQTYSPDEIAIRFKHRLVCIHCFPNGNGRHSRLMADIIIENIFNIEVFSWGAANLNKHGDARTTYIQSLKSADRGDYNQLLKFARS